MSQDKNLSEPEWFGRAMEAPGTSQETVVEGKKIHFKTWGEQGNPGIVLIHGSNAHAEWWRFVAPFLADQFHVAALDLSGNGDSEWRDKYAGDVFAKEVYATYKAADMAPRPFVVGHSFGGFVALETGHYYGAELGGVVFMDFTVGPKERYVEWGGRAKTEDFKPNRKTRVYETKEAALARFRFIPEQPNRHPYVLNHIANASLRQVDGGWTWKFDPTMYDYLEMGTDQEEKFLGFKCRSALMLGEHSEDEGAFEGPHMHKISGQSMPVISVPTTFHHLMFDEPLAVSSTLKGIILTWLQADRSG